MTGFTDVKPGDMLVEVTTDSRGKPLRAVRFSVSQVYGGRIIGLPCYADGEVMLYFSSTYRASSGCRIVDPKQHAAWRSRLARECPAGIRLPVYPRKES